MKVGLEILRRRAATQPPQPHHVTAKPRYD